ncbi:hypothetical protein [Georgenia yuyongxinii]
MRNLARAAIGALFAAVITMPALPAFAGEPGESPLDDLVDKAVEVSAVPLDEDALAEYFSSVPRAEAEAFIESQLVANTATSFEAVPLDSDARQTLADTGAPTEITPMATGCWTAKANRQATALAGNVLYTYFTTGGWCSSGSTVTDSWFVEAGGETSTPGWRYEGILRTDTGVYSNQGRTYSQHQFVLGAGGWDVQSPTPCARVGGTSAGTYYNTNVCSVS